MFPPGGEDGQSSAALAFLDHCNGDMDNADTGEQRSERAAACWRECGDVPQELASRLVNWSHSSARDCKTYEDKNIDKLAEPFAKFAAAFLEAYQRLYGEVTITSAYRTSKEQVCVCQGERGPCAGRPHVVKTKGGHRIVVRGISRHQLGIALDVRPGMGSVEEYRCLHKFASLNPQFGVYFPLGSHDYPHMELRSPDPHYSRAAMPASTALTACSKVNASIAPHTQ